MKKRKYKNYEEYIEHQKDKLGWILKNEPNKIKEYDRKYRRILKNRLKKTGLIKKGMNVLCLGARIGTEVKAFKDLNCFAVGIDLITTKNNPHTLIGDFHDIQFPNNCTDIVFTNSIDHSSNLKKLISEIKRVLKDNGLLFLEIRENQPIREYESIGWENPNELIKLLEKNKFKLLLKLYGKHLCKLKETYLYFKKEE